MNEYEHLVAGLGALANLLEADLILQHELFEGLTLGDTDIDLLKRHRPVSSIKVVKAGRLNP